jgi:response regulator NasT
MNLRILIADDEPIIRMGLKAMLQEMGHSVTAANNGREALRMAHNHNFDLAILDVKMPFTDGLQTATVLGRENPLPIVLLTAFSERDLIERASDLPIQGYLVKPVQPGQLAAAISVALKRFAESQQERARSAQLEETLEERKLIERAKGKLMAKGLTEEEAHRTLQRHARETRQTMLQIARLVLGE